MIIIAINMTLERVLYTRKFSCRVTNFHKSCILDFTQKLNYIMWQ